MNHKAMNVRSSAPSKIPRSSADLARHLHWQIGVESLGYR